MGTAKARNLPETRVCKKPRKRGELTKNPSKEKTRPRKPIKETMGGGGAKRISKGPAC